MFDELRIPVTRFDYFRFRSVFRVTVDHFRLDFVFKFRSAHRCDALRDRRDEVEEEVGDQVVRRIGAAVHGPDHVPHFLLEVPLEGQSVEVGERLLRDLDVGLLLNPAR